MDTKKGRGIGLYLIIILVLLGTVAAMLGGLPSADKLRYSDVLELFEKGQVKFFDIDGIELRMTLADGSEVKYDLPGTAIFFNDLGSLIRQQRLDGTLSYYDYQVPTVSWWSNLLPYVVIIVIMGAFWIFLLNRQDGGAKNTMNFARSRAKLSTDSNKKVSFADVAGADEEKNDLVEIVEFLRDPRKFLSLGARIPKGVLLVGPPGTGKTLIAKATAGEAGVPFFSISGSDFVELYVGVGASRVRDLFSEAKKHAPSIVFIDEIDAVGRRRGAGLGGGHDEREQTLNQLLVEMDGFGNNAGVIILAATNRADILDPAILRPGRFDRQIYISVPDRKGRAEVLKVHAKKKPFEKNVDFNEVARSTIGFTGADLENLLNEAALLAARREKTHIGNKEIDDSFLKVIMGNEKKSRVITPEERKKTAFHEAGHAIVAEVMPTQDPIQQVSIIPRGRVGGFVINAPKEDKYTSSKREMEEEIAVFLAGRAAEEMFFGEAYTGASNDIERASKIARAMVTKYGMSEKLGTIAFGEDHDEVFLGRDFTSNRPFSESTAALIDQEVKAIIDDAYRRCREALTQHQETMQRVVDYLLEYETMDGETFLKVFNNQWQPPEKDAEPETKAE